MLRKILLSTIVAVAAAGSAVAADLPYRTAAPYVAAPIFTWTGFYVGLNAGAGWNNKDSSVGTSFNTATFPVYAGSSNNDTGFTGGAQAGYNMQFGSFVAGVEADINYIDRGNSGSGGFTTLTGTPTGTDFRVTRGDSNNWFGTVRARLGFAFDRALIYATGGLAYGGSHGGGSVTQRDYGFINNVDPVNPQFASTTAQLGGASGNNSNIGWALGGGLEYAFSNSWSLKAEYLHVDLGSRNQTFTTLAAPVGGSTMAAGGTITVHDSNRFDIVRAGVNFRF